MTAIINQHFNTPHLLAEQAFSQALDLQSLPAADLKARLDELMPTLSPKELDHLAQMISLEKLEEAVRIEYPEHVSALQTAKKMLQEAKYYLGATSCKASPTLKARLQSILHSLLSILESVLRAFGIAEFFKTPENAIESEFKGQKIMMLLTLFSLISGILMPLLGAALGAAIIGGTMLTISALSVIYPYIKPQATALPRGENWSQQYRQGDLLAVDGRKETLDAMAHALISGEHTKTHLMLLGKTGIGKTATAKAFVQAVERGDYPELQGKQIIYFNTAMLLGSTETFSSANKILAQISETMGRHRDNFILIFDEIHKACQEQEQGTLSEQLKTFLDPGKDKFPHVICMTTEEEYYRDIYGHNPAFARRFQKLVIGNTDDPETVKILKNAVLKQAPETILDPRALPMLLQKTQAAFDTALTPAAQPATSLKILSQCLTTTARTQRSDLQARVDQQRSRLQNFYAQGAGELPYDRELNAPEMEEELGRLETELAETEQQLTQLFQDRDSLLAIKKATMKAIVKTENWKTDSLSKKNKQQLNLLSLQSHFQIRQLERKIREQAAQLQVKLVIDEELIDEVIAETQRNDQRVAELVVQARGQIEARAG